MPLRILYCVILITLAGLAGCAKKTEAPRAAAVPKPEVVAVVKESERSRSFLAVNQHLELGGTLYGYVDVDGDVQKIAGGLHEFAGQLGTFQPQLAPLANQDLAAIAGILGLTDIKAAGVSSVPDGSGYFRNSAFFYLPGERHGLLRGFGGAPRAFKHLGLAPADTAFYAEAEVDVPVVYQTIRDVVTKVAGEQAGSQMEAVLKKAGENAALSILDLIHGLKGNSALVMRVDSAKTISLPAPGAPKLPAFSLLICVEGVASVVEPSLAKVPMLKRTDVGSTHVYELAQPSPVPEIQPVIVADGSTLYFATSRAFLDECRNLKTGLAAVPEFQRALAAVGTEGNGLTYIHPRLFDGLRRIGTLNPNLPPQAKPMIGTLLAKVPQTDRPIVALRTNLPDGILIRSYWHRSMKQELAMVAFYNPVSVGLVAAMAIPAFQKVRASSQEKAVLNNLRQLAAARDQYFLEHGVTSVTYDKLVGPAPTQYIKHMQSVVGEDYSTLRFELDKPLEMHLPDGRVVRLGE